MAPVTNHGLQALKISLAYYQQAYHMLLLIVKIAQNAKMNADINNDTWMYQFLAHWLKAGSCDLFLNKLAP